MSEDAAGFYGGRRGAMDLRQIRGLLPSKLCRYWDIVELSRRGLGARRIKRVLASAEVGVATIHRYIKTVTRPYKTIATWLLSEDNVDGWRRDALLLLIAGSLSDFRQADYVFGLVTAMYPLAVPVANAIEIVTGQPAKIKIDRVNYVHRGRRKPTDMVHVYTHNGPLAKMLRGIRDSPQILMNALEDEEEVATLLRFSFAFDGTVTVGVSSAQIRISYFEAEQVLKTFKALLENFGITSVIVPDKGKYPALSIWRREDVERFLDAVGIFGWKGLKLEDAVQHRSIAGKVVKPEHYVDAGNPLGYVPPAVAAMYHALKSQLGDLKLRVLNHLYSDFLSELFTPHDLRHYGHLVKPLSL